MNLVQRFTQSSLLKRVLWAYLFYALLNLLSFAIGFFLLPEGVLQNTPYSALAEVAAQQTSFWLQFLSTPCSITAFATRCFALAVEYSTSCRFC